MQLLRGSLFAVLFLHGFVPAAVAVDEVENPLGKVLALLDELAAKVQRQAEEEMKTYKEFTDWCRGAARDKGFEIKTAKSKKDKLEAAISKYTGDAEAAGAKIEDLAASLASDEGDLKSATAVREKEAQDYKASETELMDVINTIGRAITILEREMAKNPAAFTQVDTSSMDKLIKSLSALVDAASFSSADKKKLLAMVQSQQGAAMGDDEQDLGAPAAATYKSHSAGILDVLEDLKEKAEEQLSELRKAETTAKHNYQMLKQSLEDQMAADSKDMQEEKVAKASASEQKATAEGDLAATVKDLADAEGALELAQGNCMTSAADHDATVKAREEELEAIKNAMQLLQNSTAGASQKTYSLLQLDRSKATSALQTRADLANAEVVALVKRLAQEHHSAALAQLASRIAAVMRYGAGAGEDPFKKVKELISELIARLQAEAGSESNEKAYCDEQLAKTEEKKAELNHDISKLTAKIDQAVAKSAGLKNDVRELQTVLKDLAYSQAEMDKIRTESHAVFVETKADLEMGLQGVRKALGLLREFYGTGASSLMQDDVSGSAGLVQQPAVPEQYAKSTGAGSTIIGMLEVVESDFAKNLATAEAEEDDAEVEYQKTTQVNKVTRTLKEQDVKYNTQEFQQLDRSIGELTADRETADAELNAVLEYYAKIKERCIAKPDTYEERKARREAEIAGLKEALSILEDEAAFVQRGKKANRGAGFLGLPGH